MLPVLDATSVAGDATGVADDILWRENISVTTTNRMKLVFTDTQTSL